jgi:Cof subfamily protein (haloacid dehalogenase superfamily)
MQYRMVCLDLDGTLLNSRHEITPYTKSVIGRLQRDGVAVVLVSARMPQAMERFHEELGLTGPMIAYGGGSIFQDGKAVRAEYICPSAVKKIVEKGKELGVHISLYQDENWYVPEMDAYARQESATVGVIPTAADYAALMTEWERSERGASKILPLGKAEGLAKLAAFIKGELAQEADAYVNSPTYIEILPHGVDKASGIEALCQVLNLTREQSIAVGDTRTDVCMLEYAGLGVAMRNASPEVQATADLVTEFTNDEEGAARMLADVFHLSRGEGQEAAGV